MSRLDHALNIDDLKAAARRRLPKILFDFIEGGVDDETGLRTNLEAFRAIRLVPRYFVDTSGREQGTALFGQAYASPFGIGPTGMAGLFARDAELHFAAAAAEAGIPYPMSGASNASMEDGAKLAQGRLWYQIYVARNRSLAIDLVKRAVDCGLTTIAVTCDVPVTPNRERNRKNVFSHPLRLAWPIILDSVLHLGWTLGYLRRGGMPTLGNWERYAGEGASAFQVASLFAHEMPDASQNWRDLDAIRRAWPGTLLLKGVMHPDDARIAVAAGVDGLIVSNHGARQLDLMPSSLDMLPLVRAAVGPKIPLLADSGIRRGSDIAAALCLGADFVLLGRAPLYGAIAGGLAGVKKAIAILQRELDLIMGQLGVTSPGRFGPDYLLDGIRDDYQRRDP